MKRRRERLALRGYAVLLRLYPKRHRLAFSAQMLQTFTDEYRALVAHGGKAGLRFWLAAAGDVVTSSALVCVVLLGSAVLLARLVAVAAVLILPFGAMLVLLVRRGQRAAPGRWWRPWLAAALLVIPVVLFARAQARSANTNTQCMTAHTPTATPPATLATAAGYTGSGGR